MSAPCPCAGVWQDTSGRYRSWPWTVLHQYAHSRIPFSPEHYASVAKLSSSAATQNIREAVDMGWVRHSTSETRRGPKGKPLADRAHYVGRLTRRR